MLQASKAYNKGLEARASRQNTKYNLAHFSTNSLLTKFMDILVLNVILLAYYTTYFYTQTIQYFWQPPPQPHPPWKTLTVVISTWWDNNFIIIGISVCPRSCYSLLLATRVCVAIDWSLWICNGHEGTSICNSFRGQGCQVLSYHHWMCATSSGGWWPPRGWILWPMNLSWGARKVVTHSFSKISCSL